MNSLKRYKEETNLEKRLLKKELLKVCFREQKIVTDDSFPTLADSYYMLMFLAEKQDVSVNL